MPQSSKPTTATSRGTSRPSSRRASRTPRAMMTLPRHDEFWAPRSRANRDVTLPMSVRRIVSHPRVEENLGRVALARGPLLNCLEQAGNPEFDVRDVALPGTAAFNVNTRPDLPGGKYH